MAGDSLSTHLVDPELSAGLNRPAVTITAETLQQVRDGIFDMLANVAEAVPLPSTPVQAADVWVAGREGAPAVRVATYRPDGADGPLPAYLHMHGGGYFFGASPLFAAQCKALAATLGCFVASIDYRVAPETPFPGAVEDCYSALKWIHENAFTLGVDPSRVAIGGESAGGGLAAALAILARDRGGPAICFQCLTYPMLDDRTVTRTDVNPFVGHHGWSRDQNRFGWTALLGREPGGEGVSPHAAAARADDFQGLPPAWIMVGALDLFLEENMEYARQLLRAGVPTELHVFPGAYHGFETVAPEAEVSKAAGRERVAALHKALRTMRHGAKATAT
jgi:acetyl esterase/lipase